MVQEGGELGGLGLKAMALGRSSSAQLVTTQAKGACEDVALGVSVQSQLEAYFTLSKHF